jgi:hypothetical protein
MIREHQGALKDAERRVQEAKQQAVYKLETTSPVEVQGRSGDAECIARVVTIQGKPSADGPNNKRGSRLRRRGKLPLPLLQIAEHET